MVVAYGNQQSTRFARTLSETDVMVPGRIYHAMFKAEGIQTYIGWEESAIARIHASLYNQGCEPVYIGVDNQNNTVTFQYRLAGGTQEYGEATSAAAWLAVYPVAQAVAYIAIAAAIVIAVWLLSLTIVGGVKELSSSVSDVITDNPVMTPIMYGGIAIVIIALFIYMKRK